MSMNNKKRFFLAVLPLLTLLTVSLFYTDGWLQVGGEEDTFWMMLRGVLLAIQTIHIVISLFLSRILQLTRKEFFVYIGIQVLLFVALIIDTLSPLSVQDVAGKVLLFWGYSNIAIYMLLAASLFSVLSFIRTSHEELEQIAYFVLWALVSGSLLATAYYFLQPLWPLGISRLAGMYGELIASGALSFLLFFVLFMYRGKAPFFAVTLLTLVFLSIAGIAESGRTASIGMYLAVMLQVNHYPFLLSLFSFVGASIALDFFYLAMKEFSAYGALLWGGVRAFIFYMSASMFNDLVIHKPYWMNDSIFITDVFFYAVLGAIGAVIGFFLADFLRYLFMGQQSDKSRGV